MSEDELDVLPEPMLLPEELPVPEPMVLVLPLLLPVLAELPALPDMPPLPEGVPVLPIGVVWELCWPAPCAGLGLAGWGGLLCATAVPTTATVAKPASNAFTEFVAII